MTINLMCPLCMCQDWNQVDNDIFTCNECGETFPINDMISGTTYYVYCFINDDWGGIPFYVGKGSRYRMNSLKGRSRHIKAICNTYNWHSKVIRYCDNEKSAYEYEEQIKKDYKSMGFPIIDAETTSMAAKLRQIEGIAIAKKNGKYKGGNNQKKIPNSFYDLYDLYIHRSISKTKMATELKVSRPTLDKWIKDFESGLLIKEQKTDSLPEV